MNEVVDRDVDLSRKALELLANEAPVERHVFLEAEIACREHLTRLSILAVSRLTRFACDFAGHDQDFPTFGEVVIDGIVFRWRVLSSGKSWQASSKRTEEVFLMLHL